MASEELQSLIKLIPSSVKITYVNELIEKLKKREVSYESDSELNLVKSFLSELRSPFIGNNSIIAELLEVSFDFLWFAHEKDLNFCHLISSAIGVSMNAVDDETNVALTLQKNLQIIIKKCSSEVIDSASDFDIQVNIIVLDSIINALRKKETLLVDVYNELSIATELLLDVSLRTLDILKTFLVTFKKFLEINNNNQFLKKYWDVVKVKFVEQRYRDNYLKCELFILCFLADFYIVSCPSSTTYPLYYDTQLWEIIQAGLIDDASLIRKQSLYLLKRYVSVLDEMPVVFDSKLFSWNKLQSKEILEYWNSYFIIWEALEDKQIHLIVPALRKFETIIDKSIKNVIHLDWMYCLFIFCFRSDSVTIVKSSIMIFCEVEAHLLFSSSKYKSVLHYFFNALNNMVLFSNNSSTNEDNFKVCLGRWFQSLGSQDEELHVFNELISILSEVNLSSVPIFYIMKEIEQVPWKLEIDTTTLHLLKKIMKDSSRGQNIKIRSAVQNLMLLIASKYALQPNFLLEDLADFLLAFPSNESLKRGTKCWKSCAEWLHKFVMKEKVMYFLDSSCNKFSDLKQHNSSYVLSVEALARIIVLFEDASLLPEFRSLKIFNFVFSNFSECDKRPYINAEYQNLSFNFVCRLLIESIPCSKDLNFNTQAISKICEELDNLIIFLCGKLKSVGDLDDIDSVDMYLLFIDTILNNHKYFNKHMNNFLSLYKVSAEVLEKETLSTIQKYFAFKVQSLFYISSVISDLSVLNKDNLILHFNAKFFADAFDFASFSNVTDCETDKILNNKEKVRKLASGKSRYMWSGIYYTLSTTGVQLFLEMFPLQQVYDTGINSFYMGEKENIVYVLQIFKLLIPAYIETLPQCVEPIFTATWKACFDIRKTDLFWKAFDKWIEMVYQECTFGNTNYHSILKSYCNEILNLGNDIFGLTNLLIERFYNMRCAINLSPFAEILHSCLIFGPILRKDQRIEKELCDCIESMGEEMAINVLMPGLNTKYSTDVRIFSLSILLDKDTFERNNLVKILISELLQSYKESCKSNRYFNDSLVHRKRNRILQTLLALNSLIINDVHFHKEVNELLNFVNENLLCESQQPSIRYQLEWLYILLVNNNADDSVTRRNLWDALTKASNERLGSVCSFISIAYHLVKLKQDEDFFEEFLENVLPWCMSQNFNIRLYAQVTLKKLLSQYKNVSIKYDILTRNQWKIYQQGNMLNNAQKLETDFYFDCFNPFKHFSLQTIFWDLPRLSNVSSEEWIPLTVLKEKITNKPEKLLWGDEELEDVNSLSERLVPNWILKAHGSNSEYEEQYSVQKKFTPWKGMFPQEIDSDHCSKKKGELILVASLIDKTSNLGGLARTCEVFGAKELIIDSLNFINDKQFTSLSMTAEKHINITEVKSYHLSDYLNNMKKFGYTVVGAEQTTESISLSEYKFNKKTLLILGSEREGIPVNILPFLDACIEIPQYGLIRSLNVHVTGAICLWEYAKQHY